MDIKYSYRRVLSNRRMRHLAPLTGSLMDGEERERGRERGRGRRMILYRESGSSGISRPDSITLSNGKGIIGGEEGEEEKESSYTLIHSEDF